jgi:hypothetical protein
LDGGFYIYTWQVIEELYDLLPTAVVMTTKLQLKQQKNTRIDHVMCHVGGVINYVRVSECLKFGWNWDEVWMIHPSLFCFWPHASILFFYFFYVVLFNLVRCLIPMLMPV